MPSFGCANSFFLATLPKTEPKDGTSNWHRCKQQGTSNTALTRQDRWSRRSPCRQPPPRLSLEGNFRATKPTFRGVTVGPRVSVPDYVHVIAHAVVLTQTGRAREGLPNGVEGTYLLPQYSDVGAQQLKVDSHHLGGCRVTTVCSRVVVHNTDGGASAYYRVYACTVTTRCVLYPKNAPF